MHTNTADWEEFTLNSYWAALFFRKLTNLFIEFSTLSPEIMPQSHPTMGPVRFLSPVRFLARKAEWSPHRNFMSMLVSWSHQAMGPVRLDTAVYLWFGWIIRRTPRVPRAVSCASCEPRTGIYNVFHILRGPCVTRKGAVRRPYGLARELAQPELAKIPHGRLIWPYGPLTVPARAVHGLFKIPKPVRGLQAYNACIKTLQAGKIRTAPHGARAGPYDFCAKQPGTARTGPGSVMWQALHAQN